MRGGRTVAFWNATRRLVGVSALVVGAGCGGSDPVKVDDTPVDNGPPPPAALSTFQSLPGNWSVSGTLVHADGQSEAVTGHSVTSASLSGLALKEVLSLTTADGVARAETLFTQRPGGGPWVMARGDGAAGHFDIMEGSLLQGSATLVTVDGTRPDGGLTRASYTSVFQDSLRVEFAHSGDSGATWAPYLTLAYVRDNAASAPTGDLVSVCAEEVYHGFDFWLGDWNAVGPSGTGGGTNDIKTRLDGCILEENWVGGGPGTSFNMYDSRTTLWYQMWVASGSVLIIQGQLDSEGVLSMQGLSNGIQTQRITWTPLDGGKVRQFGENLVGATWTTAYDLTYTLK